MRPKENKIAVRGNNKWFRLLFILGIPFLFFQCANDYDEKAIAVAGVYDAYVQYGYYNFDMDVTLDGNDDVIIEA